MKQVLQSLETGATEVAEVPMPRVQPGHIIIASRASLVSVGTERMLVEFGRASLLDKARQQPGRVRQVLDKAKTDGLIPTIQAVRSKLSQPLPLGYCNAGVVLATGAGVTSFAPGDRVVSNGPHAEVVCVPQNLCAAIPDETISFEHAAFTVIASVALQGLRLVDPTLGETVVVVGLGLVGLLAVQLLRANGCAVIGLDFDGAKLQLARKFGAHAVDLSSIDDPVAAVLNLTGGRGADGVVIAASTKSSEPVANAARMCRKRGRIVLVGVTGLELSRADFYEKELSFQVSCSYGPGRYDPEYELKGRDYPLGFVRWTETRNFEAVLSLIADGRLDLTSLLTHRYAISDAAEAYRDLAERRDVLGLVLTYPELAALSYSGPSQTVRLASPAARPGKAIVGVIGAGNYAAQVLLPALRKSGAVLHTVATSGGVSSASAARRFGFAEATTDIPRAVGSTELNTVFISTRHDSHCQLAMDSLMAGKHVFLEKPLAINREQTDAIEALYASLVADGRAPLLSVGFNRRFSPHVVRMRELIAGLSGPKSVNMTVNAGFIAADHWTQDPVAGGGRVVGEACHFVDLVRHLVGASVTGVSATKAHAPGSGGPVDSVAILLSFADGSMGSVNYISTGHRSYPKERVEVFCGGKVLILDNFRSLVWYGFRGFKRMKTRAQDKGHAAGVAAFIQAVEQGLPSPIPFGEILEVTRAMFDAMDRVEGR